MDSLGVVVGRSATQPMQTEVSGVYANNETQQRTTTLLEGVKLNFVQRGTGCRNEGLEMRKTVKEKEKEMKERSLDGVYDIDALVEAKGTSEGTTGTRIYKGRSVKQ